MPGSESKNSSFNPESFEALARVALPDLKDEDAQQVFGQVMHFLKQRQYTQRGTIINSPSPADLALYALEALRQAGLSFSLPLAYDAAHDKNSKKFSECSETLQGTYITLGEAVCDHVLTELNPEMMRLPFYINQNEV